MQLLLHTFLCLKKKQFNFFKALRLYVKLSRTWKVTIKYVLFHNTSHNSGCFVPYPTGRVGKTNNKVLEQNKNFKKKKNKNTAYQRISSLWHCLVLVLPPSVMGQIPTSQLHRFLNGPPIHLIGKKKCQLCFF